MSENSNIDDQIKNRMAGFEVKPPEEVWQNIQKARSFGHVTANRIMQGFFLMGGLALLILGGYCFLDSEQAASARYTPASYQHEMHLQQNPEAVYFTWQERNSSISNTQLVDEEEDNMNMPAQDATASIGAAALFLDPSLFTDQSLKRLLSNIKEISVVQPFELVRYEHLEEMENLLPKADLSTLPATENSFTYWKENPFPRKKKAFSVLISYTHEFINKDFQLREFLPLHFNKDNLEYSRSRIAHTLSGRIGYNFGRFSFLETGIDLTRVSENSQLGVAQFSGNYSLLSVPLLFGQEIHFNRWGWEIKAGLAYQLYSQYEGRIYGSSLIGMVDLNPAQSSPYKSAGVVSMHVASGLLYQVNEKVRIILEPYYKRNLNSLTKSGANFSEKTEFMGITAGAKLDL